MKLTESGLRNIIRQELKKTLNLKEMSMQMQRSSLPLEPDTLMINNNKDYDNYIDNKRRGRSRAPGDYVGTRAKILEQAQVASSENVATPIEYIGTEDERDKYNNGEGLHPVILWLAENPQIKFVYDDSLDVDDDEEPIVRVADWVPAD